MAKQQPTPVNIFFNHQKVTAISIGIGRVIDDLEETSKDPRYPWTPEARTHHRDMLAALRSAAAKLKKFANIDCTLPPYKPGDEDEFFTKPS